MTKSKLPVVPPTLLLVLQMHAMRSQYREIKQPKDSWENIRWEDTEWGAAPCRDGRPVLSQLPADDETWPILNKSAMPTSDDIHFIEQSTEPTDIIYENTTDKTAERFTSKGEIERGENRQEDYLSSRLSPKKDYL